MKALLAIAGVVLMFLTSWPAAAQQGTPVRRAERPGPPPQGRPMPQHREDPRTQPPQDRMTPEERQQLRRDIRQHGRDVYRERRQEGSR